MSTSKCNVTDFSKQLESEWFLFICRHQIKNKPWSCYSIAASWVMCEDVVGIHELVCGLRDHSDWKNQRILVISLHDFVDHSLIIPRICYICEISFERCVFSWDHLCFWISLKTFLHMRCCQNSYRLLVICSEPNYNFPMECVMEFLSFI